MEDSIAALVRERIPEVGVVWDVGWIDGFTRGGGGDAARLLPAGAVAKDVGKGVEGEWLVGREGRGGGEEKRGE